MGIFEKVAKLDKKIKDAKAKLLDPKKLAERTLKKTERSIEKLDLELATDCARSTSRPRRATG